MSEFAGRLMVDHENLRQSNVEFLESVQEREQFRLTRHKLTTAD